MKKYLIVFMMLAVVAGLISCNAYGSKKMFNSLELYYTKNVTDEEVDALCKLLISEQLTDGDNVISAQLNKEHDVYQFRMVVVKDGYEDDKEFNEAAELLAYMISQDVFNGKEVEFHLCNDKLKTVKKVKMAKPVENEVAEFRMLEFNGAEIEYDETVNVSEVKALGNYLVESGFTDGSTKSIFLSKENDAFVIYMVSSAKYWEDDSFLSDVKLYTNNISSEALKSEPVKIVLCDEDFNPKVVVDM